MIYCPFHQPWHILRLCGCGPLTPDQDNICQYYDVSIYCRPISSSATRVKVCCSFEQSLWYWCRADCRLAPSQWETSLQSNTISHWLGINLEWVLWCTLILTHWGWDEMNNISQMTFFKRIFFNENVWISIKISLKFVPKGPINNIPALVQIMAWRRSGDKPLSEAMMVSLPTHICVIRPQWVKHITHTQLETHWCVISIVATDAMVLKHQAISSQGADLIFIVLEQIHAKTRP